MARITGQFGEHRSYYKPGRFHEGVDLAFAENSPIKAYGGGRVTFVGVDPHGYGNYMKILADDGTTHLYAHANRFNKRLGDIVHLGDELGLVGQTGRSTGPHLHFGVYKQGKAVNPMDVINQKPQLKQSLGQVNVTQTPELQATVNAFAQQAAENQAKDLALREQKLAMQQNLLNMVNDVLTKQPQLKTSATTMEDVLNAPTGFDKVNAYLDYLNSPEKIRQITRGLGGYTFDKNLNPTYAGEDWANSVEKQLLANRKLENERQKSNLDLTMNLMKELGMDEREANKLQATIDKNNQDYDIAKEKNNIESLYKQGLISNQQKEILIKEADQKEKVRHNKASEGLEGRKINETVRHNQVTEQNQVNGGNTKNTKQAELQAISDQLNNFESMFKIMPSKLNAMTAGKIRQKFDIQTAGESEFNTRSTLLFNTIARTLGGEKGVLSDQDIQRVKEGMPQITDSLAQKRAKMKAINDLLEIRLKQYGLSLNGNSVNPQTTSNINVNKNALEAEMKRRGLK